jgi:L-seryl-tRNA(Ser) seleniumtransferase
MKNDILKNLPNMNSILEHALFKGLDAQRVKLMGQEFLDDLRKFVLSGEICEIPCLDVCAERVLEKIEQEDEPLLRGVINATGVVLHTNLGRAPLGAELYAQAEDVFSGYSNLEYDLETGQRGNRHSHVEAHICRLTGAEAAMAVNNNAAAVMLMLAALAGGKGVAVSRGELVEIGGSFRVPDVMEQSGAKLIEVGTTNKTHLSDYSNAFEEKNAEAFLKVHTSNYEIVGFTQDVSVEELSQYAKPKNLPVLYDMGSCFLIDPNILGIGAGETAQSALEAGADVICFSGDKLIGATQAGIIAGRKEYIDLMKKHPLARAVRADKLTLSALEIILRIYRFPEEAKRKIPALKMLSATKDELLLQADFLSSRIKKLLPNWDIKVVETIDETGGGSLPNVPLKGAAVAIVPKDMSVDSLEQTLRKGKVPIIARIHKDKLLLSMRSVLPGEDGMIVDAIKMIASD